MGRPSTYSDKIVDAICSRLMDGESLQAICRSAGMPSRVTVLRWLGANEAFRTQYARAREAQAEALADEIVAIADDEEGDVQRSRLRVDARKWVAAKLLPKKYGDASRVEHTGADGGPIETRELSDVDVARRIAFMLAKGAKAAE